MNVPFEITEVDWSNPDVQRVVEMFGWRYEQKCKEVTELIDMNKTKDEKITELIDMNKTKDEKITWLEKRVQQLEEQMKSKQEEEVSIDDGMKKSTRSYNIREYKNHPQSNSTSKNKGYQSYLNEYTLSSYVTNTVQRTADILFCPIHGTPLSANPTDIYTRTIEDVTHGGGWQTTLWTIHRRYCTQCCTQHTAAAQDVLGKGLYGIHSHAQVAILRNLVMSFETIQKIFAMICGRFIPISVLESMYDTVSDACRPLYDEMMKNLKNSKTVRGDHTGWFYNSDPWFVATFVTDDITLYHIAPTKNRMSIEAILQDFGGIMLSDSDSTWNGVGSIWQKCLGHYNRNIEKTLKTNKHNEFQIFAHELQLIINRAIKLYKQADGKAVPEKRVGNLQKRINRLARRQYTDQDCKRFVKRLKREAYHILTFLIHDIEYHNNTCERAVRLLARLRKTMYGNRSMRGIESTETVATICATCEMRRINPYHFFIDFLNGRLDSIPNPGHDAKTCTDPAVKTTLAAASA